MIGRTPFLKVATAIGPEAAVGLLEDWELSDLWTFLEDKPQEGIPAVIRLIVTMEQAKRWRAMPWDQ